MVQISRSRHSSRGSISLPHIVITAFLCALSFYSGNLSASTPCDCSAVTSTHDRIVPVQGALDDQKIDAIVKQRVQAELSKAKEGQSSSSSTEETPFFSPTTSRYINGVTRVSRDAFIEKFDYGNPYVKSNEKNNNEAILFYNTAKAFPSDSALQQQVQFDNGSGIGMMDISTATENCDTLNVLQVGNPGNTRQCLALMGDFESYHLQRWMRVPPTAKGDYSDSSQLDKSQELRRVSRGHTANGANQFQPPSDSDIKKHWKMLQNYFDSFEEKIGELKVVAEKVAVKNTIIVMTCNMGQSELLMNFVCNAKAKGLDISNILLFPTDQETKDLAEGLGLATFFDEKTFADTPSAEAKHYMDRTFVALMFAKVVCVQMINHLGYDLLFQDVDLVWYKNPLEYFHDEKNPYYDYDMYFQDDGARSTRYAPLSANSGFYYVRNNPRTRYMFTSLLYSSDLILQTKSHQAALILVMNDHISNFGLKVKTLNRDMDEFPGGWHYHRKNKKFMMSLVKEEISPIIFHMSWTNNKDNKVKYYQQMGEWYVNDMCIAHTKKEIMGNHDMKEGESLLEPCCLAEPHVVCHYRDKPSKIPCRDVDPIDKGRPSFW